MKINKKLWNIKLNTKYKDKIHNSNSALCTIIQVTIEINKIITLLHYIIFILFISLLLFF